MVAVATSAFLGTGLSCSAPRTPYIVDTAHPAASDANPGTDARPWKTIQKAANTLVAGDTVLIKRGTYRGTVRAGSSGRDGAWITYRAYPGHERQVVLDGSGFQIKARSYIKVSGLRVQEVMGGPGGSVGFDVVGPATNIVIAGNSIYHTLASGISVWGAPWQQGEPDPGLRDITIEYNTVERANDGGYNENITVANGVTGFSIRYNQVFNGGPDGRFGGEGIDVKYGVRDGWIHGNHVYSLPRIGIYVDAATRFATDIAVFDNRVHDTPSTGITIGKEGNGTVDGISVHNNLVYGHARDGIDLFPHFSDDRANMRDIEIINNTTYGNGSEPGHGGGGIVVDYPTATGVVVRNNIAYGNTDFQLYTNVGVSDYNLTTDPRFVSAGADFRLAAGSPAIDAGSSLGAPSTDLDGRSRPRGAAFDIGAYEY